MPEEPMICFGERAEKKALKNRKDLTIWGKSQLRDTLSGRGPPPRGYWKKVESGFEMKKKSLGSRNTNP